jgi:hypothetical protein
MSAMRMITGMRKMTAMDVTMTSKRRLDRPPRASREELPLPSGTDNRCAESSAYSGA